MRHLNGFRSPVILLAGAAIVLACTAAVSARPDDAPAARQRPATRHPAAGTRPTAPLAAASAPSVRKSAFDFSVHQALQGKVMGYSFLLMKDGQVVSEGAGGSARNVADGVKPMTTRTPQNLGSLFKFITGMSMLHVLERPPAGSAGGKNTFQARLNAPAALLYPQIWQDAIKTPAIRTITIRQLLQHKSGFRNCKGGVIDCFGQSFDPKLMGVWNYENVNFELTGYLLAVYTKPGLLQAINGVPNSMSLADRDNNFQIAAGQQMDSFLRSTNLSQGPRQHLGELRRFE